MREIKFRGKMLDGGRWIYGSLLTWPDGETYILYDRDFATTVTMSKDPVRPETVGQYTGLKDKNGKEIYEGDIIEQAAFRYDKNVHRYRMAWIDKTGEFGAFEIGKPIGPPTMYCVIAHFCKIMEVIGNIHDTPELLKED